MPGKKADPKKPAGKSANSLEEISDNRPREVDFTKESQEGEGIEITEEIANELSKAFMNV